MDQGLYSVRLWQGRLQALPYELRALYYLGQFVKQMGFLPCSVLSPLKHRELQHSTLYLDNRYQDE